MIAFPKVLTFLSSHSRAVIESHVSGLVIPSLFSLGESRVEGSTTMLGLKAEK